MPVPDGTIGSANNGANQETGQVAARAATRGEQAAPPAGIAAERPVGGSASSPPAVQPRSSVPPGPDDPPL